MNNYYKQEQIIARVDKKGNIIGKIASGIADDLLTTTIMAADKPALICPAMNDKMLSNSIVQDNIKKLQKHGYLVMESGVGELACKTQGSGRLPDVADIVEEIDQMLTAKDLAGEKILITAGPTQEPLDPVRHITNLSSGKMGYALATAAVRRGAEVTLISGPTTLSLPKVKKIIQVRTACQMHKAVMENYKKAKIIIKAAAVADYRPAVCERTKIKKKNAALTVSLKRNPDIISEAARRKGNRIVVGFSMESDNVLENARAKLMNKGMDFIVANDVTEPGAGFRHDTNIIRIIDREGAVETFPLMDKVDVAGVILDRVKKVRDGGRIRDGL